MDKIISISGIKQVNILNTVDRFILFKDYNFDSNANYVMDIITGKYLKFIDLALLNYKDSFYIAEKDILVIIYCIYGPAEDRVLFLKSNYLGIYKIFESDSASKFGKSISFDNKWIYYSCNREIEIYGYPEDKFKKTVPSKLKHINTFCINPKTDDKNYDVIGMLDYYDFPGDGTFIEFKPLTESDNVQNTIRQININLYIIYDTGVCASDMTYKKLFTIKTYQPDYITDIKYYLYKVPAEYYFYIIRAFKDKNNTTANCEIYGLSLNGTDLKMTKSLKSNTNHNMDDLVPATYYIGLPHDNNITLPYAELPKLFATKIHFKENIFYSFSCCKDFKIINTNLVFISDNKDLIILTKTGNIIYKHDVGATANVSNYLYNYIKLKKPMTEAELIINSVWSHHIGNSNGLINILIKFELCRNYLAKSKIFDAYLPLELIQICDTYFSDYKIIPIQMLKNDACAIM